MLNEHGVMKPSQESREILTVIAMHSAVQYRVALFSRGHEHLEDCMATNDVRRMYVATTRTKIELAERIRETGSMMVVVFASKTQV
jgi:hypothetical protein